MFETLGIILGSLISNSLVFAIVFALFSFLGLILAAIISTIYGESNDFIVYPCLIAVNAIPVIAFIKGIIDGC